MTDNDHEALVAGQTDMRAEIRKLRAKIEQLKAELARIRGLPRLAALDAENERLRALLAEMLDIIKDCDGGNPQTNTGWASDELCDLWMQARLALEQKP